jgi:hypothetical protein
MDTLLLTPPGPLEGRNVKAAFDEFREDYDEFVRAIYPFQVMPSLIPQWSNHHVTVEPACFDPNIDDKYYIDLWRDVLQMIDTMIRSKWIQMRCGSDFRNMVKCERFFHEKIKR